MECTRKKSLLGVALFLSVIMTISFIPSITFAAASKVDDNNTFTTAPTISVGQKIEAGGTAADSVYYNVNKYYKFTVASPSEITLEFSTVAETYANIMTFNVWPANTTSQVLADNVEHSKSYNVRLDSTQMPLSKTLKYKLLAGTYYINFHQIGSLNGRGFAELKSIVPTKEDTLGEPNDSLSLAMNRSVKSCVTYVGNINYYGKENNNYNEDESDYFKFVVPRDNSTIKNQADGFA